MAKKVQVSGAELLHLLEQVSCGDERMQQQAYEALERLEAPEENAEDTDQDVRPHRPKRKVTAGDVPRLLEDLSCGTPAAQRDTLELLCPCRNRVYDREVWLAIFKAYEHGVNGAVRDQAGHAIGTLRERARNDPRSQELLAWLAQQNITSLPLENAIPTWQPISGETGSIFRNSNARPGRVPTAGGSHCRNKRRRFLSAMELVGRCRLFIPMTGRPRRLSRRQGGTSPWADTRPCNSKRETPFPPCAYRPFIRRMS